MQENTSRKDLMTHLELGEGTIRSILDILKNKHLITSTPQGHARTEKGNQLLTAIQKKIEGPETIKTSFYQQFKQAALMIYTTKTVNELELRDEAIRNGAHAAIIATVKNGKILMQCKEDLSELETIFPEKTGVLVVIFAQDQRTAQNAGLAVAQKIISVAIQ